MQEAYGYPIACGYYGYVEVYDTWMIFATESEYEEYISEFGV